MPYTDSFTTAIAVNGIDLREYEPPADERSDATAGPGRKRIVYIEAVDGQNFDVRFKARGRPSFAGARLGVTVYLDNVEAKSLLFSEEAHRLNRNFTSLSFTSSDFLRDNTWFERKFMFRNLATTDTDTKGTNLKEVAKNLGTIRVQLRRWSLPTETGPAKKGTHHQVKDIPEKALKGQPIDLAAGFGNPKPISAPIHCNSKPIGAPLLDYVFKYRSRKALQMLDLIPVTPEPIPLHERDPNTLSLAEARELLAQIRARDSKPNSIKQENMAIKRERDLKERLGLSEGSGRKRRVSSTATSNNDDGDDDVIFVEAKRVKRAPSREVEVLDLS